MTISFSLGVRGELRQNMLLVTIDNPPVNALSRDVRSGLMKALDHAATTAIDGIVIVGAGKTFIGGADIREFGQPPSNPILPDITERIEAFTKPVVAAINGTALGGGLEVALACHYRIASSHVQLGLPEVKLGIVPGAGATQRLPRLTGIPAAIALIGSGRSFKANEALSLGIIDTIAKDELIEASLSAALRLVGPELRRTGTLPVPTSDRGTIELAQDQALAKSRGQLAPNEAVRLVASAFRPLAEGLADERATFVRLRDSQEAAALRYVFFAERQASRIDEIREVKARPVETIGIVGLGLMGSGIAVAALGAGYKVIGLDRNCGAASKGRDRIFALLDRAVASGRMDQEKRHEQAARLEVGSRDDALVSCDLVIEAVFDDLDVKIELVRRLGGVLRPDAIIATNTSYLNPDDIAAATVNPERVVGLHFFSPAHVMRLVEVVRCTRTAPEVLATGIAVAKRLRKLPVITGVAEGFIGNRIFSAYRREAEFMLEEGALPHQIDAALEDYGFPMGLFAVNDMAGLEIAWARRKREAGLRDPGERYVQIADRLCEAGRLGQKSGRGWYAYRDGKRQIDTEVTAFIEQCRQEKGISARTFTALEITDRLIHAMAKEGRTLLDDGIAMRESDIDLVMINGYGFPAHKGGPMYATAQTPR